MRVRVTMLVIITSWLLLVTFSFFWNLSNGYDEQYRIALESGQNFYDHIVITRLWNSNHGGVYVPVTETTAPNRYFVDPNRDIKISESLVLTKINPAYMTRQISEIAQEKGGVQFHITSLKPLRPGNRPTYLERKYLLSFEQGKEARGEFINENGKTKFFYMAPLVTEQSCLKCHEGQGYKRGDIRGGISVTSPFVMQIPWASLISGHAVIALFGLIGIGWAGQKLDKAYTTIKGQAVLDALTGVPNRRGFTESILREFKKSLRYHNPLAVIMCDVDNFKQYNDTYGHAKGDECLKQIAQAVKDSLVRPEDFCGRYGGEEFVVVLPNTPLEGACHVAETIRRNVEQMGIVHENAGESAIVTLSLGVRVSCGSGDSSYEDIVREADCALYEAKAAGRNQVHVFADSRDKSEYQI